MKIGIVGSRSRDSEEDYKKIVSEFLKHYTEGDIIVSGGAPRGADRFAEEFARSNGFTIIIHNADWSKYGKGAGPIRNTKIAQEADILVACVAPDRTDGTEDCIRKFVKLKGEKNLHIV